MNVSVRGTYPGNMFDTTPYVQLSDTSDNFTSADLYQYRRSINVSITGWAPVCSRAQAICKAACFPVTFILERKGLVAVGMLC